MPQSEPVTILIVNAIAEEIKLVTLNFRRFFPNSRVEAVYSVEEALQWGNRAPWQLILIDENLLAHRAAAVLSELKQLAPHAPLVLLTDQSNSAALSALQAGADFLLDRRSPAFLTELVLYTKGALVTRAIRMTLKQTEERHARLIEIINDGLYELDVEGRFVYVSPLAAQILGYTQDELIGTPYSTVVPPDQQDHARHRFNDRRTGTRAARQLAIDLIRKPSPDKPIPTRIRAEISARGLYDFDRRYLGTLGLLRDISQHRRQTKTIDQLEHQLRESDRLLAIARRIATLSKNLDIPHNAIQIQSQLLLKTIRDAHLIEQVDSLATYAAEAVHLGQELARTTTEVVIHRDTLDDIIETVLASVQPPLSNTGWIEQAYGQNLPSFSGNLDSMMDLIRILISHARRYVAAAGNHHRLQISTRLITQNGLSIDRESSTFSQTRADEIEIHIQETDSIVTAEESSLQTAGDLFEAYALIKRLGGRLDFLAPVDGFLSIKTWIPVEPPLLPDSPAMPSLSSVSSAGSATDWTTEVTLPAPAHTPSTASFPVVRPSKLLPDRRKNIRATVALPARMTIGNVLHKGVMTDLSPSGATFTVEGIFPSFEQQPVYLLLKTVGSILELDATAHDRGETPGRFGIDRWTSRLALEFIALNESQQKIIASLIDAARVGTHAVTVEAQFPPLDETKDLTTAFSETSLRGTDYRETIRVRVALPVHIETSASATGRLFGLVVNFSRGGVCLQTESSLTMTDETIVLHFSSIHGPDRPRAQKPEASNAILTGHIVHLTPDPTVPSEPIGGPSPRRQRFGIRFSQLTPFAEREVNRVIAQHIGSSVDVAGSDGRSPIVSNRWECQNTHGQTLAVMADHARQQISPGAPIVIISPGFGSIQTDYVSLSYYLAANDLRVLRYDHSNHVGQSEGCILQTTLSNMQADLLSVLDFAHTTWPTAPVSLLSEDIAARVAVKVMAQRTSADRLFLLNPVLDIETALSFITCANAVATYRQGHRRAIANLWGVNVDFDQFVDDAITGEYVDLASSTEDIAQLVTSPVILVSPRKNRPIEPRFDPESLRAGGVTPVIVSLPADISGESDGDDERRAAAFKSILNEISTHLIGDIPSAQMREPDRRDVYRQRQLEYERTRIRYHVSQATRSALWGSHLAHLPQLEHMPSYLAMMDGLYGRLLPLEPGMTVLDIGCGQGNFVHLMQTNQAYRSAYQEGRSTVPLHYIGLGQSLESLRLAEQHIQTFTKELHGTLTAAVPTTQLIATSCMHADWNSSLPFTDRSIKRILCHLSLSFTLSPLHCLREMLRVLHPDGIAVLTCFQPHTDLSTLFRRHLRAADHDEFGSPALTVLHYLGRLREAIRHGLLHNYERTELTHLLAHAGAGHSQVFSTLDDQLLLAIVRKTKSAG